jgi:hypothetical protein
MGAQMDRIETQTVLILDLRHPDTLLEIHQSIRQEARDTGGTRRTKGALVPKGKPEPTAGLMNP